ncbi:MAG: MarR family transcriptional regulator [Anaerolineae bacterium]|nr:MarR family transcriptional regulator [Anaerolineae bacterium]
MRDQTTHQVYRFLCHYFHEHGFMPSQQEIADACLLTQSGISRHLDKLARWGWIEREDGKARGLRLLKLPDAQAEGED